MLAGGSWCWRNSSFPRPGAGTSPARSPPARESGTQRELREGPVKFIPYFSPLHPPPPCHCRHISMQGRLWCVFNDSICRRLSSLTPPFLGLALPPASPGPAGSISLLRPRAWTLQDPGAVPGSVRQPEQSSKPYWKGRGQSEASSGERGRERLRLGSNEGEAV